MPHAVIQSKVSWAYKYNVTSVTNNHSHAPGASASRVATQDGNIYFAFPRVNECPLEIFSVKLRYLVELVTKQLCQNFNAIIQGSLFVRIQQNIPYFLCLFSLMSDALQISQKYHFLRMNLRSSSYLILLTRT